MAETARKAALATLVAGGIVVLALALWQLRIVVALLFLAFILAAAMRPGIEALARAGVPRVAGIMLHYAAILGILVGFLWVVVPRAVARSTTRSAGCPRRARSSTARHASRRA